MQSRSATNTGPVRTWRLLLCDDSPVERMALGHMLRTAGYEVDEAGDGESALHHLQHRQVDLLLLDLNMPEMDGFGVLTYLQKHRPGLPVVLLSGMPLEQIQHKMHRLPPRRIPRDLSQRQNRALLLQQFPLTIEKLRAVAHLLRQRLVCRWRTSRRRADVAILQAQAVIAR